MGSFSNVISNWYQVPSSKLKMQRTSKARDSYKQCSIPNKSQAMNSVLKGFICNLQICQPKADFDPAINVIFLLWFIDTPNNPTNDDTTARDLAWVAQPVTCVTSSLRDGFQPATPLAMDPFSICRTSPNWVHPRFICDLSSHRKREMYLPAQQWRGMAWHEVQQVFWKKCLPGESERARAKGEWTTDQLWSGIHFEEAGRKAFCDPMCLMVWAEMCENSSCDPSASEMCKIPFEEALDQKNMRFTHKKGLFSWAKIHLMAL